MIRRPQFSLKTLLWLMAVVAAFFAGAAWQRRHEGTQSSWDISSGSHASGDYLRIDRLTLPDGTRWFRPVRSGTREHGFIFSENGVKITVETKDAK